MPLYDYKCQVCGRVTEVFQRKTDSRALTCSHCGAAEMEKLVSAPGAIIKARMGSKGKTCCGRDERCDAPPCSSGGTCSRD